jgi:hypothetical protein
MLERSKEMNPESADARSAKVWISSVNVVAGIWLIIGSFILGSAAAARTNDIVLGIVVLLFGLWSQAETEQRRALR